MADAVHLAGTQRSADEVLLHSLVVVGSSAGGIEALSTLVATLPVDLPAPVVLAQHLDPRLPSHLGEILARRSTLPVRTVTDREALEPGVVYVVPAGQHVEIADHEVHLRTDRGTRPRPSIDRLLTSAAGVYGERLIAVILTGTGSDGASGARAVKAAGGMVVIENPATAAYPGMPESLAPSTVDMAADLPRIGPLLRDLLTGAPASVLRDAEEPDTEAALQALLEQVRERSGVDFGHYKRPTILRRLQRRMVAIGVSHLPDYTRYLARHPEEYARLIASFLIHVTEFFRDPDLYANLRDRVLPELVAHARAHGNELRIWSAGCATGEEAYSLAILVAEALGEEIDQFTVQLFATDVDEEAVMFARRGVYPAASLAHIPQDMRARYFAALDSGFEVRPRIRNLVIFGQHDLGQRAPFPRIDLVLCRNVLMYFTPELQRRALQLFAFSLRDGGYLALGKAETAKPLEAYFAPTAEEAKVYRRRGKRVLAPIERIRSARARAPSVGQGRLPANAEASARATPARAVHGSSGHTRAVSEQLGTLVLDAAVGVVVVDRQYDIQIINAAAIRLLGIYSATAGKDLIHLTRGVLADPLQTAIDTAFQLPSGSEGAHASVGTVASVAGEERHLQIAAYPREVAPHAAGAPGGETPIDAVVVLVLVSDITGAISEQQAVSEAAARGLAERQFAETREPGDLERAYLTKIEENEHLRAQLEGVSVVNRTLLQANQELVAGNIDLRGANEDLLVRQEETEAGAEEIKTLNEELQATNEELVTVNEEMEATVEELHTANDDLTARGRELQRLAASLERQREDSDAAHAQLAAILLSMGDALLVVDAEGDLVFTNAAYERMFGRADAVLVAEDAEGRPLPPRDQPQRRAAAGQPFTFAFALTAMDGSRRWFEATGQPVRSDGVERGGVVTIRDITDRRLRLLQDEFVALASHELRSPLNALSMALQLIKRGPASTPEDPGFQTTLHLALRQGQRLRVLVNDLQDVGRLQQGKLELRLAPVDLVAVVAATAAAAQLEAQGQAVVLDGESHPLMVLADAVRLEQIVLNLVTNAIKYAPGTQRIDVHLARIEGARGASEAELRVRDYGPGIAPAELPLIFTRYFQSAQAGQTGQGGLGLGLFITKELVEAHGGSITAASTLGEGTTFTVRLPLQVTEDQRRQRRMSLPRPVRRAHSRGHREEN